MKKMLTAMLGLILIGSTTLMAQDWQIYDGSILPENTLGGSDSLDLSSLSDGSPGPGIVIEVIDDEDVTGNKILKYLNPDGKTNFRHYFDDGYTGTSFTIMARVKAHPDTSVYDRAFDFEWRNGNVGFRDKLYLWTGTDELELDDNGAKVPLPVKLTDWHTYRIVVESDSATIYLDENPVPIHAASTMNTTSDQYIKIGDGSGSNIGGYLDWSILDSSGAYAPGEGADVPLQLIVDSDTYEIPDPWLVYDGSLLPGDTYEGGDSLDISSTSDNSPGPGMVQEIIDDYLNPGNKILKYLNPDGKTNFRHYFADSFSDSSFTIMGRIRGEMDPTYDRAFDFEWRNGNADTRDKLLLWTGDDLIELDNDGAKIDAGVNLYRWHTFRIAVSGDTASVYIDENPVAVHSATTSNSTSDTYLKVGDGSGDNIGGYMDWLTINMTGAWAPEEGLPLPEELIVDDYMNPEPEWDPWLVYDGSVLPENTSEGGDTLDISSFSDDSPGAGIVQEIMDDPDVTGNKLFKYLNPDGKRNFRHYFPDSYTDSAFTIMARVRGDTSQVFDRVFDFEWRNGNAGTRDKFYIWGQDSTVELDNIGTKVNTGASLYEWHTYRIVVVGDYAEVYMDENPVPMVSGTSTNGTSDTYLKIGDGSGDNIGGYVDWVTLNLSGAWPPGSGLDVPGDLIVDEIELPEPPKWLIYDASLLPSETAEGGDTLDISNVSESPAGANMVEELVEDPDIPGNHYLKVLHPDADSKKMYRYYFDDEYLNENMTIMTRIRAENDVLYDRAMDVQWRNGNAGTRDELRIWPADSTLELEKADLKVKVDMDLYQWHTYRIEIIGDTTNVYVDERNEPSISGISASGTSDRYIKFGDGSGDLIGGHVDWFIVDLNGAYPPGDGLPIPEDLFVDIYVEPIDPGWLVYTSDFIPLDSNAVTGEGILTWDSYSQDGVNPTPGWFTEELVDDPDIDGNKYLKFISYYSTRMYRWYFPDNYKAGALTMMARVRADDSEIPTDSGEKYDRAFDLTWRVANSGFRDDLRIWAQDSTIELEKADKSVKVDMNLYDWHTYRMAFDGKVTSVYLDEQEEPVLVAETREGTNDNYIKIGDGSGEHIAGHLDWYMIDLSGAYAPGEGVDIPEYLFVDSLTVTSLDDHTGLPMQYTLSQNYPNPFNPSTTIAYDIPKLSDVNITLYNMLGQRVMTIVDREMVSGSYTTTISMQHLASGVYFYRIKAGDFTMTRKMMLLK